MILTSSIRRVHYNLQLSNMHHILRRPECFLPQPINSTTKAVSTRLFNLVKRYWSSAGGPTGRSRGDWTGAAPLARFIAAL